MAYFFGYLGNMFGTPQYRAYLDYVVLAKLEHLSRSTCGRKSRKPADELTWNSVGASPHPGYRGQYHGLHGHDTRHSSSRRGGQNHSTMVSRGHVRHLWIRALRRQQYV